MDEVRLEQERQFVNPFPLSKQSVLIAFGKLSPEENPSGAQEAISEEERLLGETNPHVLASLKDLLEYHTEKNANKRLFGALVFHRALREEAKSKDMTLPTLSKQFVDTYDVEAQDRVDRIAGEAFRYEVATLRDAARKVRKKNVIIFRHLEPEFSRIAEEKLSIQSSLPLEDDER